MKIKNIAFFGVMATILSVAGANAAGTTPATVIASTNYVDTKTGKLTDLTTTNKTNLVAAVNEVKSNALTAHQTITEGTENGTIKVGSNNVAVHGLGSAAYTASTAYDASGAASTAKSNIETKLAAGANGYDINANTLKVKGTAVLTSHQSITEGTADGTIKVGSNNVAVHGLGSAAYTNSTAYDASGAAATARTNAVADVKTNLENTTDPVYDINAKSLKVNGTSVLTAHQDISGKENSSNKSTTGLITAVNATTKQITTISAGDADHYASTSAISSDLNKVKDALSKKANSATTLAGYGITDAYTQTQTGTAITNAINNLNGTTSADGTGTKPVIAVSETNGVVNVQQGTITYDAAMNSTLPEINGNTNNECSPTNPCILTYAGTGANGGYKWTTLDLGVVAQ